jgi:hypothetical protein
MMVPMLYVHLFVFYVAHHRSLSSMFDSKYLFFSTLDFIIIIIILINFYVLVFFPFSSLMLELLICVSFFYVAHQHSSSTPNSKHNLFIFLVYAHHVLSSSFLMLRLFIYACLSSTFHISH